MAFNSSLAIHIYVWWYTTQEYFERTPELIKLHVVRKALLQQTKKSTVRGKGEKKTPRTHLYFAKRVQYSAKWSCMLCIPFIFHLFSWLVYNKGEVMGRATNPQWLSILQKYGQCLQESDTADLKCVVTLKMSLFILVPTLLGVPGISFSLGMNLTEHLVPTEG